MNKIKQINISDFRIYQEKQEFKFQNDKGIANLVALYAPNGYGKTSFFDAIEWGYSDRIARIGLRTDDQVQELDHNEDLKDKIILTNRLSYKKDPNVRGLVEFITEKGNLNKEVVLYTRKNTNGTKNDYKEGKVSGDLDLPNGHKLVEFNILSQDQIDRFLRHLSPEDKFKELKDFWIEGEESLNKYKNVDDTIKNIEKKLKAIKIKSSDLDAELKEIVFDKKKIDEINNILGELEKEEILDYNFSQLKEPLSKELFEDLSKELSLAEKGIAKKRKSEIEKLYKLNQLKTNNILYKENLESLKPIEKDINGILEKKKFYNALKSANVLKEEIDNRVQRIDKRLSDYRKISDNRISFLATVDKIKELSENKEKNNRIKQQLELNIAIAEKWISSLTRTKSNWINDLDIAKNEEEKFKSLFKKYTLDLAINKEDKKQLPLVNNNIIEIQKELDSSNKLIKSYQSYITESNWVKDTFETDDWQQKVDEYKSVSNDLKIKKEILKDKIEIFKRSGNLKENLNRIKLWGKEYVESNMDKNCPLCNTPFDDFEALLKEIHANTEDLLKTENQSKVIDQLEETIRGFKKQLDDLNHFFTTKLNSAINTIKGVVDDKNKEKENTQIEIIVIKRRINLFSQEYADFIESLKPLIKKDEEYSEEIIPELIERYTEKKDSIKNKIERIQAILDWKYEYSDNEKGDKIKLTEKISEANRGIFENENNEIYKITNLILKEYGISKDKLEKENYVNYLITEDEKKLVEIDKIKENTIKKINDANNSIKNSNCKIEELDLDGNLVEKEKVKTDLEKAIKEYKEDYHKLFRKPTYLVKEIENALEKHNKNVENIDNYEKTLLPVIADLELIENGLRKQDIEDQLKDIEKENGQLTILNTKVSKLRDACMEYIQSGISNYFNKEVINQIYQKIEPHPELKEIGFKAEMGNKGPRLIITAKGDIDEINPNLFLSAGQVNILSLSIFLAKAFEYGQDTISTIFMDDPIQNLSDINILSFIDVLRSLITEHNKQIVISTHDEKFFRLLQNKLPEEYCNSKYIEFESEGKLKKNRTDLL